MTTSIYPEVWGDLILDLRYVLSDGVQRPAMVVVDKEGKERTLGKVVEVRDGGGHVELFRFLVGEDVGFDRDADGKVKVHS